MMMHLKILIIIVMLAVQGMSAGSVLAGSIPPGGRIKFEIDRNGAPFGSHQIDFTKDKNGNTIADITIHMQYELGFVTLFRYDHKNHEIWSGDRLVALKSTTSDDGKDYAVDQDMATLPGVYSTSYWNEAVLKTGKVINTQKGMVENINVKALGVQEYCIVKECYQARAFDIVTDSSKGTIHVWYDNVTGEWIGLKFNARGSDIEYRRLTPIRKE